MQVARPASTTLLLALALAQSSCLTPTPFGTEPDEHDRNAQNLARIQAVPPSNPYRFVALADTHDAISELADAVDRINARHDLSFVLVAGDLTDRALLKEFELTERELSRLDIPYLTVIGNHDAIGDGIAIFRKLYGPLDFTFEYGGVKFVLFNSNSLEFEGRAPDRPWLAHAVLDIEPATSAVWLTHQSISNPEDTSGTLKDFYSALLEASRTSLVVHGHLEQFELQALHDTPVLQCGTFQVLFEYHVIEVLDGRATSIQTCDLTQCQPERELP